MLLSSRLLLPNSSRSNNTADLRYSVISTKARSSSSPSPLASSLVNSAISFSMSRASFVQFEAEVPELTPNRNPCHSFLKLQSARSIKYHLLAETGQTRTHHSPISAVSPRIALPARIYLHQSQNRYYATTRLTKLHSPSVR